MRPRSASKGDPFDRRVLIVALAASELYGLGGEDLVAIVNSARRRNRSVFEVLDELQRQPGILRLRPEIAAQRPDLLEGFDAVIQLVRRSVERRRPADADKAHKNLLTLIAAYVR